MSIEYIEEFEREFWRDPLKLQEMLTQSEEDLLYEELLWYARNPRIKRLVKQCRNLLHKRAKYQ